MKFTIAFGTETLNCEIVGPKGAPVVAALGGISADCHVTSSQDDPTPGWWESVVGSGKAVDTWRFRVLSMDYAVRPVVSTKDQADALALALDVAGVNRLHALVGASYGGMVALAFGVSHSARTERLIVIGAAHESDPMATALRALQRRVIELGRATDRTREGVILARALAMTTYGTAAELADRFPATPHEETPDVVFPVEDYLLKAGERFATRCSAERYVALSLSLDLHRIQPEDVTVPTTVIALLGDRIVPRSQVRELARRLGAPCEVVELLSRSGHDAFLKEPQAIAPVLERVLNSLRVSRGRRVPRRGESRAREVTS
ncbi:MAG: homoserine O-succinyltransferase [Gemmatimonadaceae bacterium]|nr:homoserine O-succinyltransferase [Gemmatimonadaceae bacterium]